VSLVRFQLSEQQHRAGAFRCASQELETRGTRFLRPCAREQGGRAFELALRRAVVVRHGIRLLAFVTRSRSPFGDELHPLLDASAAERVCAQRCVACDLSF